MSNPAETPEHSGSESNCINLKKSVKVYMIFAGETFHTDEAFVKKLKRKLNLRVVPTDRCKVILVFCPVVSRIGTDMDAAMARVPEDKPVIMVFMHHCHSPSHMINITVQPSRDNIVQVVHCAFHETKGLLECKENKQAVKAVCSKLKALKKKKKNKMKKRDPTGKQVVT